MIKKNLKKNNFMLQVLVGFILIIVAVSATSVSFAQNQAGNFESIKIKNFGQMDERFYRGGQPKEADYKDLASLGVKTVIDLRDDPESYEKRDVEALGMSYVNIPMNDKEYPRADQIDSFLKLTSQPETGKFFVHCAGGRHRTGVMGAVYRFTNDHWTYDQVYSEMKTYDFYTRFGHGAMKKYVQDFWQRLQTAATTTENKTTGTN